MAPDDKTDAILKFTLYRLPEPGGGYQEERFNSFIAAGEISGVPV
jgi:hypothetical protein